MNHTREIDPVLNFNHTLIGNDAYYTINDYLEVYQEHFYPGDNLSKIHLFVNRFTSNEFCILESELPGTMNIRKIIRRHTLEEGVDFVISKEFYHSRWPLMSGYRKIHLFTPSAFKKLLVLSGDSRFVKYYVFLDNVIAAYARYQSMHARD